MPGTLSPGSAHQGSCREWGHGNVGLRGHCCPSASNRRQLPYREVWHCFPVVSYLCVFRLSLEMGQLTPRNQGASAKLPNPSSIPFPSKFQKWSQISCPFQFWSPSFPHPSGKISLTLGLISVSMSAWLCYFPPPWPLQGFISQSRPSTPEHVPSQTETSERRS